MLKAGFFDDFSRLGYTPTEIVASDMKSAAELLKNAAKSRPRRTITIINTWAIDAAAGFTIVHTSSVNVSVTPYLGAILTAEIAPVRVRFPLARGSRRFHSRAAGSRVFPHPRGSSCLDRRILRCPHAGRIVRNG
jgi:hypothetical protein